MIDDDRMEYEEPEMELDREISPPVDDGPNENFRVAIRVRPPLPRELEGPRPFINVVRVPQDHKSITLCEHLDTEDGRGGVYTTQTFSFDYVYEPAAKQMEVYNRSAKTAVMSVLQGYNATMIAYGQTGTGKTFTMEGFTSDEQRGIIPRATEEVFSYIQSCRGRKMKFLVRASYLQIYNEAISDLLKPLNKNLRILQTKQRGVYVENLSEWVVRSPHEIYGLMERGCSLRATGSTRLSELSSRSHAIFIIIVEIMEGDEESPQCFKIGKLNIVDLAGSEKVRQTGVTGQRLEETKKINWSLHELGNVIAALTDPSRKDAHVPYRNSKLTNLLKDSLGGNCKTTLIACISPAQESYHESLSSLKFANRAKNIKNDAVINEDLDQRALLRKYEAEVKRLRALLAERESGAIGYRDIALMQELEDRSRRAEEDRVAALEALQQSSRAYDEQIQSKRQLEQRIEELETKIATGEIGAGPSDLVQRMEDLDKERMVLEEDKAQIERYKQLLLKQRDIMLNLTTRLNERDETILRLEEEIDAYDSHVQTLEDAMECSAPTMSTKLEAEEHLARRRTRVGPEVRYRSEAQNSDALLSAEEKIVELMMLKGRTSNSAASWDRSDEKKSLELIVKERIDVAAKRLCEDQIAAARREIDCLRENLAVSEEKRRAAEYTLELGAASSGQQGAANEQIIQCLEREARALKEPYQVRVADLQKELEGEREQRRRVMRELEKSRFEIDHIRSLVDPSHSEEISRLWTSLSRVEDNVHSEMLRNWSNASPTVPPSSLSFDAQRPAAHQQSSASDQKKLAQFEKTIETLQSQLRRQQAESRLELSQQLEAKNAIIRKLEEASSRESSGSGSNAAKEKEIAQLKKANSTHLKDRKALMTIMETRMKTKVDNIANLLAQRESQERNERIENEVGVLQNLIIASINALKADS